MPSKPKKPCGQFGCPELTTERYCPKHQHKVAENNRYYDRYERDKKASEFYHSAEWIKTRLHVMRRDFFLCQDCLSQKRITSADMVHHIKELKTHWHLRLTLSNLVSLCNSCHNRRHGRAGR